jgi:hypothetical protein
MTPTTKYCSNRGNDVVTFKKQVVSQVTSES